LNCIEIIQNLFINIHTLQIVSAFIPSEATMNSIAFAKDTHHHTRICSQYRNFSPQSLG